MLYVVVGCRSTTHWHPTQHQHNEIDLGLCQGLDWREVMSWDYIGGTTSMAKERAQLEHGTWVMIGHGGIRIHVDLLIAS